ncbi:MAG: LemA family protein [Verrucomicrobiae bacterium]|nr:LemA family protein [Verrucomicrobiae bacterium]
MRISALIVVVLAILILIFVLVGLYLIALYNRLVGLRQMVKNAWAQIDVQLKRRHDLIPNLVETVKGYAAHEKGVLESVISARSRATQATLPADVIKAEGELSSALARLLAVVEAYPNIKADRNFLALQEELTSTENRVAFARQAYNDSVLQLNTAVQTFPAVIFAKMLGFNAEPFFEAPQDQKEPPKVQF